MELFKRTGLIAAALVALAASGAFAQTAGDRLLSIDPQRSTLRYNITHVLHQVDATSSQLEGKVLARADGTTQIMVRASVKGFASGDSNRDEHMQEVMEAAQFPTVTFKGLIKLPPPPSYPTAIDLPIAGELEMHGKKFPETIRVHVEMTSANVWRVTGSFEVSLDKYGVERPALLLKKIDDACRMTLDLSLVGAKAS